MVIMCDESINCAVNTGEMQERSQALKRLMMGSGSSEMNLKAVRLRFLNCALRGIYVEELCVHFSYIFCL